MQGRTLGWVLYGNVRQARSGVHTEQAAGEMCPQGLSGPGSEPQSSSGQLRQGSSSSHKWQKCIVAQQMDTDENFTSFADF